VVENARGGGIWWLVPKWEELGYTPGVFVRVASKGVAGYEK
jgi:hypothetical protein